MQIAAISEDIKKKIDKTHSYAEAYDEQNELRWDETKSNASKTHTFMLK